MTLTASPPRCDASSTGRAATDWSMEALPCQTRVGLRSLTDRTGTTRYYCAAPDHQRTVERRFGRVTPDTFSCLGCGADDPARLAADCRSCSQCRHPVQMYEGMD